MSPLTRSRPGRSWPGSGAHSSLKTRDNSLKALGQHFSRSRHPNNPGQQWSGEAQQPDGVLRSVTWGRGVADPLSDPDERPRPRNHSRQRHRQHRGQTVPPPARLTRIGYPPSSPPGRPAKGRCRRTTVGVGENDTQQARQHSGDMTGVEAVIITVLPRPHHNHTSPACHTRKSEVARFYTTSPRACLAATSRRGDSSQPTGKSARRLPCWLRSVRSPFAEEVCAAPGLCPTDCQLRV